MNFLVRTLEDLLPTAYQILNTYNDQKVFLFYGDMGAGKTTFIKALCKQLGVTESTSSPTFSIVNEYAATNSKVFHFDFYRLKNESEALDMGYEEYFYSGDHCFIEWPEKIATLLPAHYVKVNIAVVDEQTRLITAQKI